VFPTNTLPYLYDAGQFTILPLPAGYSGEATAINADGVIVGTAVNNTTFASLAFVYADGQFAFLNDLLPAGSGWNLRQASDINDANQIVGPGFLNGTPTAYLITVAVPEPAAATLAAAAGLLLTVRRRT
jgi:probable HAF family extracellular repeat protein